MRNRTHGMFGAVGSLVIAGVSLLSFNAEAAIVHDEAVHGDFSDDHARPTTISLAVGDNLIKGSTTHLPTLDRDFFTSRFPTATHWMRSSSRPTPIPTTNRFSVGPGTTTFVAWDSPTSPAGP